MSSKKNSGTNKDEPIDIAAMEDMEARLKKHGQNKASAIVIDNPTCEESNNHHSGESNQSESKKNKDDEQLDSLADNVAVKEEPVKKTKDDTKSDSSADNVAVKEETGALTIGKNSVKMEKNENGKSNKIKRQKTCDEKQPKQPRTIILAESGEVCSVQSYAKKQKIPYMKVNERTDFEKLLPKIVLFATEVPGWKWNCIDQLELNAKNITVGSKLGMVIYKYLTRKEQENLPNDTLEQASEQKDKENSSADVLKQASMAGKMKPWQKVLPVACCAIVFLWHRKRKCFYKEHLTYLCGNSDRVDNLIQVLKVLQKPIPNEKGFKFVPDSGNDMIKNTFIITHKTGHNKTVYGFGPIVRKLITNTTKDIFVNEMEFCCGLSTLPYGSCDYAKKLHKVSYFLKSLDADRYNSLIDDESEEGKPDKFNLTVVDTDDLFKSPNCIEEFSLKMHDPEHEDNIDDTLNVSVPNHEENTKESLNVSNPNSEKISTDQFYMSDDDDGEYEVVTTDQSQTSNDDGGEDKDVILEL